MDKLPAIIALCVLAAAVIGAAIVAYRRERRAELEHDEPGRLDDVLPTTVAHTGAEEDWSPVDGYRPYGDPLDRELSDIELADALLFEEIAAAHPVRLDWQPPSFTQSWMALGEQLADLGDTQVMEAVAA